MTNSNRAYESLVRKMVPLGRKTIFAALCDMGSVARLLPEMLSSSTCEGSGIGAVRSVRFLHSEGWAQERCDLALDESVFVYSLIANHAADLLPFSAYVSVVVLEDAPGGNTLVSWGSNWVPNSPDRTDEIRRMTETLYETLLDNMVTVHGREGRPV